MTTTKYFIYACLRMYETQDLLDLIFIFSKFCVSCIMRVVMNYLMLGCASLCSKKLFDMTICRRFKSTVLIIIKHIVYKNDLNILFSPYLRQIVTDAFTLYKREKFKYFIIYIGVIPCYDPVQFNVS